MNSEKLIYQLLDNSLQRVLEDMLPEIMNELMSKNRFFIECINNL